jgi:hypothetical protein
MIIKNMKKTTISLLVLAISASAFAKGLKLEAEKIKENITVDGVFDSIWENSNVINVELNELPYEPNNGYDGDMETEIEVRALHDGQFLYMMYSWEDDTFDAKRFPWQKQADGSWKHMSNKDSTKHENTWYEDKLSVFWNKNVKGFEKKGCDKACHIAEDGKILEIPDDSSGRHFTKAGEIIDEWQWKHTRINVNHQIDDGFVDDEHRINKNSNKKWGRHPDQNESGGYYNNFNDDKSAPAFMSADLKDGNFFIEDSKKIPFVDEGFVEGDFVPGIITSPFMGGSRGDVEAYGYWDGEKWHLEVKRALITNDKEYDLQFDDLDKTYYFGVATFDNSQINHLYHKKSIKLTFGK